VQGYPPQAKVRLEWGTQPSLPVKQGACSKGFVDDRRSGLVEQNRYRERR
jgi:hypothetical protein